MKVRCLLSMMFFAGLCSIRNATGARILGVFLNNGKSHFIMHREVMRSLADAGHQVDVVSHFPLDIPHPNYTDVISLAGTIPFTVNNLTYEMVKDLSSIPLRDLIYLYGTRYCELLELPRMQELIRNPPRDPPYDLVITEFFLSSCYLAFGRHLNVPVVTITSLTTMPHANEPLGNPYNTAIVSEMNERPLSHMNYWQRVKNTLFVSAAILGVRYYMRPQNEIVRKAFGPEMPDVEELQRDISLSLVNSHHIFHNVRPMTPAIVEVAGVHVYDDGTPLPMDLEKWLNDCEEGFVYFSFGSMARVESFPKSMIAEIYTAFSRIAPLCILMKVAEPKELPHGLPENVRTLTWVPQVRILKHENIRAFITHGGLMGLQEAVTFGVPLIGIPLFGDQPGNIQMCAERGIAVRLDYKDLTSEKIVAAINVVVYDPTFKNRVNEISKEFLDRPRSARETTVFWIEYILKYGGDALRSPAIKLSWWQLALIDVYGSLMALVLLVLYILKFLLSNLYRRILTHSKVTLSRSKKNE